MPSGSTAAPRTPRQDNRRLQLLDAAARLFNDRGFHATSMRDIAKEVGMLSGSIYYHFQSKEEMLLAVYEQGMQRIAEEVDRPSAPSRSPGSGSKPPAPAIYVVCWLIMITPL